MKKTRAAQRNQSLRQTKNKTRHWPLPVYKRKGDKMTERIEIENLVEDYLPGPDDNANALSFLSEQIKKRLAAVRSKEFSSVTPRPRRQEPRLRVTAETRLTVVLTTGPRRRFRPESRALQPEKKAFLKNPVRAIS